MVTYANISSTHVVDDVSVNIMKQLMGRLKLDDIFLIKSDSRGKNINFNIATDNLRDSRSLRCVYGVKHNLAESAKEVNYRLVRSNNKNRVMNGRQFSVNEISVDTKVEIGMRIISKSESDIERIIDKLNGLALTSNTIVEHTALIQYPLSPNLYSFIDMIKNTGTDIKYHAIQFVTNVTGSKTQMAVKYTLNTIRGKFTTSQFDISSTALEVDENIYSIDLEYAFIFPKPTNLKLEYNSVINNKFIDVHNYINQAVGSIEKDGLKLVPSIIPSAKPLLLHTDRVTLPPIDRFNTTDERGMQPVLSILLTTDGRYILSLDELGDYKIGEFYLDIIRNAQQNIFTRHTSIMYVTITEQDTIFSKQKKVKAYIEDLKISLEVDPDIESVYRFNLYVVKDDTFLTPAATLEYNSFLTRVSKGVLYHKDMDSLNMPSLNNLLDIYEAKYIPAPDGTIPYSYLTNLIYSSLSLLEKQFPLVYAEIVKLVGTDEYLIAEEFIKYFNLTDYNVTVSEIGNYILTFDNATLYVHVNGSVDLVIDLNINNVITKIIIGNRGETYLIVDNIIYSGNSVLNTTSPRINISAVRRSAVIKTIQYSKIVTDVIQKS